MPVDVRTIFKQYRKHKHKGFSKDPCGYCPTGLSTRKGDHLPDHCILKGADNPPKVPACLKCNKSFDNKDNKRVRFILASSIESAGHVPRDVHADMFRGLKDKDRFLLKEAEIEPITILVNGVTTETGLLKFPDLHNYVERLAKGFHYFRFGTIFPDTYDITSLTAGICKNRARGFVDEGLESLLSEDFKKVRQTQLYWSQGWSRKKIGEIFRATYWGIPEDLSMGYWEFLFYNSFILGAIVVDPERRH